MADTSQYWIARWEESIDPRGFNPFDTLAMGWLTHPDLIESEEVAIAIEESPDDRTPAGKPANVKPYLIARPVTAQGRKATYCFRPKPAFKELLIERLKGSQPGQGDSNGSRISR